MEVGGGDGCGQGAGERMMPVRAPGRCGEGAVRAVRAWPGLDRTGLDWTGLDFLD